MIQAFARSTSRDESGPMKPIPALAPRATLPRCRASGEWYTDDRLAPRSTCRKASGGVIPSEPSARGVVFIDGQNLLRDEPGLGLAQRDAPQRSISETVSSATSLTTRGKIVPREHS